MSKPLLRVSSISKSFGEMEALSNISFEINPGEIHALVGENGAGKSTLINIISGVITLNHGTIEVDGETRDIRSPREAQELGIATVFQELSVALPVSVAENIYAGRLPRRHARVDWDRLYSSSATLMKDLGVVINPSERLSAYPIGIRQLVEIAKALSLKARIILLDEPTSALDQSEKRALFTVVRKLANAGLGVVYISHHLNEVFDLSDRITVLRDGRISGNFRTADTDPASVVRAMVGRSIETDATRSPSGPNAIVLEARSITCGTSLRDASLILHGGEIVALAGLVGSGRSEFARALCGIVPILSGTLQLRGRPATFHDLRAAMRHGIGFIPGERKTEGLFLELDVRANICAAVLNRLVKWGIVDRSKQDKLASESVRSLDIRLRGLADRVGQLSGGNQQKVLMAKWLSTKPSVLIVEEPTRGVDIGAKFQIHRLLRDLASTGVAVLIVSSDLPEVLSLADQIVVMRHGRSVGKLSAAEATEEWVMAIASGLTGETARAAA